MLSGKYASLEPHATCSEQLFTDCAACQEHKESKETLIKIAFYTSWFVDLGLCSAVIHVLTGTFLRESPVDVNILGIFCAFVDFFIALTVALSAFFLTKRCVYCLLAGVFALGQFVCVMAYAVLISNKPAPADSVLFVENPLLWAEGHSRIPLAFAMVFLPVFVVQLILLADYASTRRQSGGNNLKKTSRSHVFAVYPGFYLPV